MRSRVLIVTTMLSSLGASIVFAQGAVRTLTIQEAVDEAVQRNLGLLAQRANLSVAEANVITARLRPNPVVSGGANSLDWLGTGFNDINGAGPQEYAVRVDVPFERARKRELRTELAGHGQQIAAAQFAEAVRRVKLDVVLASIEVLEAKARLELAEDNLQALERLVQLNERRLTSGAIPPLEVSRSRVAMLQYRGNVRSAQLALTQARLKLLPLVGSKPDEAPVDIDDRLGLTPPVDRPDLAALQQAARSSRPDILAAQREQARTQADLRLQIAQGKVDYAIGAEYRRQQGVNGRGNLLGLFFSAPLPIFNRNQGEIARAEAECDKATRSLTALETDLAGEVASAYEEFDASRLLLIDIERDLLKPTSDARAGTTYMYQAGATSLLDVLDAQRAYNDTMDTYYSAQAAYRRAQARLALVVGQEMLHD
jgi:cobalt-zinc-cadmium efflux system outer membrane protein